MFGRNWVRPFVGGAIAMVLATGTVIYYLSGQTDNLVLSVLKDIIFFVLSAFLSYGFAISISRNEYKRELEKLGNISARRVGRLSENIRAVSRNIRNSDEQSANELGRIARDADETNADIALITDISHNSDGVETLFCPHCGYKDTVEVPKSAGLSGQIKCRKCQERINIHKIQDGLRVVPVRGTSPIRKGRQDEGRISVDCPNESCDSEIQVKRVDTPKRVFCNECYTSFSFDSQTGEAESLKPNDFVDTNKSFGDLTLIGSIICPNNGCTEKIPKKNAFFVYNSRGERFAKCKSCRSIVRCRIDESAGSEDKN